MLSKNDKRFIRESFKILLECSYYGESDISGVAILKRYLDILWIHERKITLIQSTRYEKLIKYALENNVRKGNRIISFRGI